MLTGDDQDVIDTGCLKSLFHSGIQRRPVAEKQCFHDSCRMSRSEGIVELRQKRHAQSLNLMREPAALPGRKLSDKELVFDGAHQRHILPLEVRYIVKSSRVVEVLRKTQMSQHFNLIARAKQCLPRRFALLVVQCQSDSALSGERGKAILDALHREFNLFTDALGDGSPSTDARDPARFA